MDDEKSRWQRFQKLSFSSKDVAKRAKRVEAVSVRHARKFIARRLGNIYDVRRHVVLWLIGIALLIVAVGVQQVWFRSSYMQTAPVSGGTYAEGILGSVNTLNPLYASSAPERAISRLVFSSLLQYDTTGVLANDLASGYTVKDSGRQYVVDVRKGVRWHDSASLTAGDVVFTVELMKDAATRSPYSTQWQGVKVEQVGDYQVVFTLPSVYAAFPHVLTFPILPEHILRDVAPSQLRESAFSVNPVGTGPFSFRFSQPEVNRRIVNLAGFEHYFKGAPRLSRFEVHAYNNRDDIRKALQVGQIIATGELETEGDRDIRESERFSTDTYAVHSGVYAFFNLQQDSLKDKSVRRALQQAVDVEKLRQKANVAYPLDGPFVNGQIEAVDQVVSPVYDQSGAMKQLDAAGWKLDGDVRKKDGQPLALNIVTVNTQQYEAAAQQIADDWKALGVNANVTVVDPNEPGRDFTQNILQPRAYDVLVHEIAIGSDPDVYAFWHSSQANQRGLNLSMYATGLTDDALSSARTRIEPELRNAKYLAFAKRWIADVPAIGLFQSQFTYTHYKQVRATEEQQVLIADIDRYANVIHWTAETGQVYKTP